MTQDKRLIIPDLEREQLLNKIKTAGTGEEQNAAVLEVLNPLWNIDSDPNGLNFWFNFNKESLFQEYGVTDQGGHSYSVKHYIFPEISYRANYRHNGEYVPLGGKYREDFEKMFGPMHAVFHALESGFTKQKYRQNMQEQQLKRQKKENNIGLVLSFVVVFAATVFSVVSIAGIYKNLKEANKKTEQHEQKQYQQTKEKIAQVYNVR